MTFRDFLICVIIAIIAWWAGCALKEIQSVPINEEVVLPHQIMGVF